MNPTVITIFLSIDQSQCVQMPITPTTTALDVIEFCKEPGKLFTFYYRLTILKLKFYEKRMLNLGIKTVLTQKRRVAKKPQNLKLDNLG